MIRYHLTETKKGSLTNVGERALLSSGIGCGDS